MEKKMDNDITIQMTEYFRKSNIDGDQMSPSSKLVNENLNVANAERKPVDVMTAVNAKCWKKGKIEEMIAGRIVDLVEKEVNQKKRQKPKFNKDGKPIDEDVRINAVTVTCYPIIGRLRSTQGDRSNQPGTLIPVVVDIELKRNGGLSPKGAPHIPRSLLSPNANSNISHIGLMKAYDTFLSKHHYESVSTWKELLAYCDTMLKTVAGSASIEKMDPDYVDTEQAMIVIGNKPKNTKKAIQIIYNDIISGAKPSNLYVDLVTPTALAIKENLTQMQCHAFDGSHVGQMTNEFPLAEGQRRALEYFLHGDEKTEPLLAINGPPGTGKTTLIQTIVANLWVAAAIKGKEPPVIVATSNNNQAITNILDSFARIDEKGIDEGLAGRWLPDIDAYGLYCCAHKTGSESPYAYYEDDGSGLFQNMQTLPYIKQAESEFIAKFNRWANVEEKSLAKAMRFLHQALIKKTTAIKETLGLLSDIERLEAAILTEFSSMAALKSAVEEADSIIIEKKAALEKARLLLNDYIASIKKRTFAQKYFAWFGNAKKSIELENLAILNQYDLTTRYHTDKAVHYFIKSHLNQAQQAVCDIERQVSSNKKRLQDYTQKKDQLLNWLIDTIGNEANDVKALRPLVEQVCDCDLRFIAFKLATHYWEARWLIEIKAFVSKNDDDKRSPRKTLRKWRRFAKLTPCLVSTFYMLPKYFTCRERRDDVWQDVPLYNAIDLLIIDEAGQANVEIAGASFALAKRALVVGDTEQIEPIWQVHAGIDRANLLAFNLLKDEKAFVDVWLENGLLASSGNLMRVAQQKTPYHHYINLRRGLYLTEHRRCYDEIISYCNDMVYQGILEPLRGNPGNDRLFHQLGFVHCDSNSDYAPAGASRTNKQQANMLLSWLQQNLYSIVNDLRQHYPKLQDKQDEEVITACIAIITPFNKQAGYIRRQLKQYGLPIKMVVGTVHALQGSERNIVLFSSVYSENDPPGTRFYDDGYNMLNVAVSRAKDSFIVFGHKHVFGNAATGTPSGLLMTRLKQVG